MEDAFVACSHEFSVHLGVFLVTDSERVIDGPPTQPSTMTLEKWKERKIRWKISMTRLGRIMV